MQCAGTFVPFKVYTDPHHYYCAGFKCCQHTDPPSTTTSPTTTSTTRVGTPVRCTTIGSAGVGSGNECKLPFKYLGKNYSTCTSVFHSKGWCATEVDAEGYYVRGNWGDCSDACRAAKEEPLVPDAGAPSNVEALDEMSLDVWSDLLARNLLVKNEHSQEVNLAELGTPSGVITQVAAGMSLTFIWTSGAEVEVWSKPWENFLEVTGVRNVPSTALKA
eukprot:TRINITY_DN15491_c0_g3_i2.p1 TRINITY_DN15491_c0_g3~~TRINITY_DN15491_c0_g3_i2.p1  ORF type:complete len:218 (-),score=20.11 TRINITY_DN15491_c0_g3_i2:125-778(-)